MCASYKIDVGYFERKLVLHQCAIWNSLAGHTYRNTPTKHTNHHMLVNSTSHNYENANTTYKLCAVVAAFANHVCMICHGGKRLHGGVVQPVCYCVSRILT